MGFLFTIWSQAPFVIVKRFLGAVLIFGFLYLLYAVGTVGAGDVKLLMMISMYVDLSDYGHILILSLAVAGIMSLAVMIREGRVLERVSGVFAYTDNRTAYYTAGGRDLHRIYPLDDGNMEVETGI